MLGREMFATVQRGIELMKLAVDTLQTDNVMERVLLLCLRPGAAGHQSHRRLLKCFCPFFS